MTRGELKAQKSGQEERYYVMNEIGNYEEIRVAIKRHWRVESDNHMRDVSLKKDALRACSQCVPAEARTLML